MDEPAAGSLIAALRQTWESPGPVKSPKQAVFDPSKALNMTIFFKSYAQYRYFTTPAAYNMLTNDNTKSV